MPIVRHLWWWLGARPASRRVISDILKSGYSCALTPGGVRELEYMRPGSEVAFLTERLGFVKLAIQHGAPLIPVFAFGQTDAFSMKRCIHLSFLLCRFWLLASVVPHFLSPCLQHHLLCVVTGVRESVCGGYDLIPPVFVSKSVFSSVDEKNLMWQFLLPVRIKDTFFLSSASCLV